MTERLTRTDLLLAENLRTLIAARRVDGKDVAMACGHESSWISKILSGDRGMRLEDVGKAAAFFGLSASELLAPWISPLLERRRLTRRTTTDRRAIQDRRKRREGEHNLVAQPPASGVELARPARKGATPPYAPRDQDPATLDLPADLTPAEIETRIEGHVAALRRLYELRARPSPSLTGGGAPRTSDRRLPDRTTTHDAHTRAVKRRP